MLKDVTELAESLAYNVNSPTLIRARDMLKEAPEALKDSHHD